MKHALGLPLRFAGGEAVEIFNHPRFFNCYGLLCKPIRVARPGQPETRVPPFVELLWMPAYAIRFSALLRGEPSEVWVTVDGCGGHVQVLEDTRHFALLDMEEDAFEPRIDEAGAAELGRKGLLHYTLKQRRLHKPIIQDIEENNLFWYPIWVCYIRKRFGTKLDFRVIEAHTGRKGGARLRVAVINALIERRKATPQSAEA